MVKSASLFPGVVFAIRLVVFAAPLPALATVSSPVVCAEAEIAAQMSRLARTGAERQQAITVLGTCSNASGALLWELENSSEPVRLAAGEALAQLGTPGVIESLTLALNKSDALTRLYAAQTLGQIGWEARSAVPALVRTGQRVIAAEPDLRVRRAAIQAVSAISNASASQVEPVQPWQLGRVDELKALQQQIEALLKALKEDKQDWPTKAPDLATLQFARDGLQTQIETLEQRGLYQILTGAKAHPLWVAGGGILAGIGVGYGAIFLLRPLMLLKLGDQVIEGIAALPTVGTPLSQVVKALLPLKYHPRVLDAWVGQHWQAVERAFLELDTVSDRSIHIPLPVRLGREEQFIDQLRGEHLKPTFQKRPAVLLIVGEGGAGKTSLACQIAQWGLHQQLAAHRLLPVLIETELDDQRTLLDAIRGQLSALMGQPEEMRPELLEHLLKRQRILVIVDHFSEMSSATQKQVTPELEDFPAKALVITSRLEETLEKAPNKTLLKPLRIEADRLLGFMQAYVRWRLHKQDDPFVDDEYAIACDRLRRMVGQRNITVLLARLYTEEMIRQQQGSGDLPPASVPDLMLSYLNQLNRSIEPAHQQPDLQVQQAAQIIAWECLRQTYWPSTAERSAVISALQTAQLPDRATAEAATEQLTYLEQRLRLVQTLPPGDKVRILLDPLAEYLAAIYLVNVSRRQDDPGQFWQAFLDSIDPLLQQNNDPPEKIRGFLLAVRDCCVAKQKEARIPDGITDALARRANLDPEVLRQEEEKRRIRLLISELAAPELEFRLEAAEKLSRRGVAARAAERNLIGMMENPNQEPEARQAAAQTLGKLGIGADSLLALLTNPEEDLILRRTAAESLGLLKAGKAELLKLLHSADEPLPLRQGAARALSLIGAPSGEPVPMLIVELNAGQVTTQVKSIPVWREQLTDQLTLDLVAIPAGEFLMGSPADEARRDLYARFYSDTEGKDVEAQHRVTVPAFSMSQSPITQAQWRFVAGLPKVNHDLEPDPASFKGDNCPVETVSWYNAMEFCARLSEYTDKIYRLPSEAEWEYACRAGTTTPFHFGDMLTTEVANYDGNYTYGAGSQGIYQAKTTEVGSFGVVNAFGLFDMHGNVYEWCLDHWHPSYANAPTDGSAWETEGDDRYRLLRGGSWFNGPDNCRSADRNPNTPNNQVDNYGFRVIRASLAP